MMLKFKNDAVLKLIIRGTFIIIFKDFAKIVSDI